MKMNAGLIQDLFHYSLAMIGTPNGLDAVTLKRRMACAESAHNHLANLEDDKWDFESVVPNVDRFETEADMIAAGELLHARVIEVAAFCMIDPNTGEQAEATMNKQYASQLPDFCAAGYKMSDDELRAYSKLNE